MVRIVAAGSPEALKYPLGFGLRIIRVAEEDVQRLEDLIARAMRGVGPY